MRGGDCREQPNTVCLEPASALSADNRIIQLRSEILSNDKSTFGHGNKAWPEVGQAY